MVCGTVLVSICLLVLGWTREMVSVFITDETRVSFRNQEVWEHTSGLLTPTQQREATIVLAVLSIYALDFAINAVQASCRSIIVDTLPASKQQLGSAWGKPMSPTLPWMKQSLIASEKQVVWSPLDIS